MSKMFMKEKELPDISRSLPPKPSRVPDFEPLSFSLKTESLPSLGMLYNQKIINARAFTIPMVEKISEASEANIESVLRDCIANSIDIDIGELSRGDLLYLLWWERVNTFDRYFPITFKCPNCQRKVSAPVDITALPVKTLSERYRPDIVLKVGKYELTLDVIRDRDEQERNEFIRLFPEYPPLLTLYACSIKLVNGSRMPLKEKCDLILKRIGDPKEYNKIRAYHEYFVHGTKHIADVTCPDCRGDRRVAIPFLVDIFIPSGLATFDFEGQVFANA